MPDYSERGPAPWSGYAHYATSVDIKSGIISISERAFRDFEKLTSVKIPSTVGVIGEDAFWNCDNLVHVYVDRKAPPTIRWDSFGSKYSCILHVPTGSKQRYASADHWKDFRNILE